MDIIRGDFGFLQAALLVVLLSGIPLLVSMVVGLVIAVLQAATQIQEQTLSFIPKLGAVLLVLFFAGPWMLNRLLEQFGQVLEAIPRLSGY